MNDFFQSKQVLALKKKITPSERERKKVEEICTEAMEKLNKNISKLGIEATPSLQGSVAKDTWLPGETVNLDIFVAFSERYGVEEIKKLGLKIGKLYEYEIAYAEHPYVKNFYKGSTIDVVPCYTAARMITSVDRTPLHTAYIKSHLAFEQRAEVRLLKKFMKAQHVYGAEQKVGGFSGYLCELLILHYKTMKDTLAAASHWRRGERIDIEGMSQKKFSEPLTVIDPTDPERNVAAAVTPGRLAGFIHACRLFSENPSIRFFSKRKITFTPNPGSRLFMVEFECDLIDDILFPQLRKTERYISNVLVKAGFSVYRSAVFRSGILFELDVFSLPAFEKRQGPQVFDAENCARFAEKHRRVTTEDLTLISEARRKHREAHTLIASLVKKKEGFGKDLKRGKCRLHEIRKMPATEMF
jgi:tRNA nucleotidyltransferase (CCA-adding enzyme)